MKKNLLIVSSFLILIVSASAVFANNVSQTSDSAITKQSTITLEQARKIALKKVDGKVEDEFTVEDDDEKVTAYIFVIKDKNGKMFEVQIDAEKGTVLSSEEYVEDSDDEDPSANMVMSDEIEIVETADEVEAVEKTDEVKTDETTTNEEVEVVEKIDPSN